MAAGKKRPNLTLATFEKYLGKSGFVRNIIPDLILRLVKVHSCHFSMA
jgi:hypothetical protein